MVALLSACGSAQTPAATSVPPDSQDTGDEFELTETYQIPDLGFQVSYPSGWLADTQNTITWISQFERDHQPRLRGTSPPQDGYQILVDHRGSDFMEGIGLPADDPSLEDLLQVNDDFFEWEGQLEVIETEVLGAPALRVRARSSRDSTWQISYMGFLEEEVFLLVAHAPSEEALVKFHPLFERMVDSIEPVAFPPAQAEQSDPLPAVDLKVQPPGIHEQTFEQLDGTVVRFTLFVPKSAPEGASSPLVVVLHFGGEVTPFYGREVLETLALPALEGLDAIMVAPDSLTGSWTHDDDGRMVLQVMDSVTATYNVDQARILLSGYSLGGTGTWYLTNQHPDHFTAAIPVSGQPTGPGDQCSVPLYVIHSEADEVAPLESTRTHVQTLQNAGCQVQLRVVEGITHFQTVEFVEPLRDAVPWIRQVWR